MASMEITSGWVKSALSSLGRLQPESWRPYAAALHLETSARGA
jgi:hypothetical protein